MSIKASMRNAVAFSADKLGFLDKAESRMAGTLTILCYHRILPSELKSASAFPDLAVTPGSFRAHCETLKTRYDVRTLSDCVDLLYAGNAGPKPLASITFDDGYRDNYEYAAPVLDSLGLRATFFIIAGLAGKRETPWYDLLKRSADRLAEYGRLDSAIAGSALRRAISDPKGMTTNRVVQEAKRLAPGERSECVSRFAEAAGITSLGSDLDLIMDRTRIAALARTGHEIGAHSMTHEILPLLIERDLSIELSESRTLLKEMTGQDVTSFCYPNGDYDERVMLALRQGGYARACTTRIGPNYPDTDPMQLRRWFIKESAMADGRGAASSRLLRLEVSGLASKLFMRSNGRNRAV